MNKIVHYRGLDVHKDSIAVSMVPQKSTEICRYGNHLFANGLRRLRVLRDVMLSAEYVRITLKEKSRALRRGFGEPQPYEL